MMALMSVAIIGCTTDEGGLNLPPDLPNRPGTGDNNGGSSDTEYPLISTNPAFITESMTEDVVVILNTVGTAADGYMGDLYAHTGVLTDASVTSSDWMYTKAEWNENIDDCKLEWVDDNLWHLTIKGGPRAFYGVPEGETITHLAFVFRSDDGKLEVKDSGQDIFVELVSEGMSVRILTPSYGSILKIGEACKVQVQSQKASSVVLYKNDEKVKEGSTDMLVYDFTPDKAEDILFKAVATDGNESVEQSIKVAVLGDTESAARPSDADNGVTTDGNEATFVLFAPDKESVVLLGDFNDYAPSNDYMMKRDGDYFWITVPNLEKGVEYGYQYLVDGEIKIGDPYSTKILDPWNDKWINEKSMIYPNLKAYPGKFTSDIVSVFELDPVEYQWTATNYERPKENSLAIYELLIRDFTEEGSINAVTAKLDYLKALGVNAIELMPIQEFDGNDSWGYNPCFYFAADKAYGTEKDYKSFIDECHKRDMAVILDVVFNHATGQFPYAKMWWDAKNNKTAANNPFFNVDAPHNFSVFHDFKHLYAETKNYFDDVLEFWLEEYNVDGFRFDLTKGFVQNPGNYDAGGYSAERIGILKHYAQTIREVDEDAYVIFEHFCDQSEEDELYSSVGALCWNNEQRGGYKETVLGFTGGNKSSFANFKRGRVNNIETHDEERIAYDAITHGQSWVKGSWSVLTKRLQAIYAFHFLTPYPKMMWQFGELGYDISIEENGRTGRKPVHWEYFNNINRKALYNAVSKCVTWRTNHEDYYGADNLKVHTWKVGDGDMGGKVLVMDKVIVVANFNDAESTTTVEVPAAGEWTNLMSGAKVELASSYTVKLAANDYIVLVRE